MRLLLEAGADKDAKGNVRTRIYETHFSGFKIPLLFTSMWFRVKLLSVQKGKTALMYAAQSGHVECVRLLLNAGAKKDAVSEDRLTALVYAVLRQHVQCVHLLVEGGVDTDENSKVRISLCPSSTFVWCDWDILSISLLYGCFYLNIYLRITTARRSCLFNSQLCLYYFSFFECTAW
jgi:hypothetical protein